MNKQERTEREGLLAAQVQDLGLKRKYEQAVQTMIDNKMPWKARGILLGFTGFILFCSGLTVYALIRREWDDEIIIEMLVYELGLGICLGVIALRGRADHLAGILLAGFCGFFASSVACTLWENISRYGPPEIQSRMGPFLVIVTVVGWVPAVMVLNSYYHTRTREKLLELQLQVAELAELIKEKK